MKTIHEHWLSIPNPDLQLLLMQRTLPECFNVEYADATTALNNAFCWDNTYEGATYWQVMHDTFSKLIGLTGVRVFRSIEDLLADMPEVYLFELVSYLPTEHVSIHTLKAISSEHALEIVLRHTTDQRIKSDEYYHHILSHGHPPAACPACGNSGEYYIDATNTQCYNCGFRVICPLESKFHEILEKLRCE